MPRVTRRRVVAASRERVWDLVSDPYQLPRWFPRVQRVEDVREVQGKRRSQWTSVLLTEAGSAVRADYRCVSSAERERYIWEQEIEGTPFDRILRKAVLEIHLDGQGEESTSVTLRSDESLRGLSRLGSPMMRRAVRRRLNEALDGIERALVGDPA